MFGDTREIATRARRDAADASAKARSAADLAGRAKAKADGTQDAVRDLAKKFNALLDHLGLQVEEELTATDVTTFYWPALGRAMVSGGGGGGGSGDKYYVEKSYRVVKQKKPRK